MFTELHRVESCNVAAKRLHDECSHCIPHISAAHQDCFRWLSMRMVLRNACKTHP